MTRFMLVCANAAVFLHLSPGVFALWFSSTSVTGGTCTRTRRPPSASRTYDQRGPQINQLVDQDAPYDSVRDVNAQTDRTGERIVREVHSIGAYGLGHTDGV